MSVGIGRASCPHCHAQVIVLFHENGWQTVCDTKRHLVIFGNDQSSFGDIDAIAAHDTRTGMLMLGRQATVAERKRYKRERSPGWPFTIGLLPHLGHCRAWDGQPVVFTDDQVFMLGPGLVGPLPKERGGQPEVIISESTEQFQSSDQCEFY